MPDAPFFRIAVRAEGEFVNAYIAPMNTMQNSVLLGSMRRRLAETEVFDDWLDVMRKAMSVVLTDLGYGAADWQEPVPAPEHEKAGNA
jgi:hypothetical protein